MAVVQLPSSSAPSNPMPPHAIMLNSMGSLPSNGMVVPLHGNSAGTTPTKTSSSSAPAPIKRDIMQMAVTPNMAGDVPRIDEAFPKKGKYEITDETDFTVQIHLRKHQGRWILMNNADSTTDNHKVTFRMWTYNEMVEIKKMATSYDLRKKMHEVDNDLLNRLKIQRLLKSWTFGDSNKNLEIHHVGGTLTDESWVAFTKLQPNIAQYIINEMNAVLEYNH